MASPDSSNYNKLVDKLRELFELDKADLDFGIYRIIGQRQEEIDDFLRHRLKSSVKEQLSSAQNSQQAELAADLAKAEQAAKELGVDPEQSTKVKELREKLAALGNPQRVEHEVYEHLYRFFSRYYEEGDFISQRRVSRKARYAIPYNGEEVKLHWANADQYYIKSSENFRDYRFKLEDGRSVHFKLVDADSNRDNTKGDKRFFRLADDTPLAVYEQELRIHFHYGTHDEKKITDADGKEKAVSQSVFNGLSLKTLNAQVPTDWAESVHAATPTAKNEKRTLIEKHLTDYTAKNSFDYFIHKDLGGFLRQELDFYIKNEVMFLDDIEDADAPKVESYLRSLKAIRRVAGKVIDFLAQLEDFQKKLWLKKKFVVQCDYCITLDRVPELFYAEIVANEAQVAEWRQWGFLETDAKVDFAFLKANPYLLVDTKFHRADFKLKLLAEIESIDERCEGLLIHADNFQSLNLLQERYRQHVKCVYIDPPYNTGNDGFAYKDSYQHSSWISMLSDRTEMAMKLGGSHTSFFSSIDDGESAQLRQLYDSKFGSENFLTNIIWQKKYAPQNDAKWFSDDHDFLIAYALNRELWRPEKLARTEKQNKAYTNKDDDIRGDWKSGDYTSNKSSIERPNLYYPIENINTGLEIWPNENAVWRYTKEQHLLNESDNRVWWGKDGSNAVPAFKRFLSEVGGMVPRTLWKHEEVGHNQDGIRQVRGFFPNTSFSSPKPVGLISKVIKIAGQGIVLDYFAGSGTTGHAVINLNREDNGSRKYILVEQGAYFDTVLKPRIQKVVYSENWKDGKPVAKDEKSDNPYNGVSHCFKYMKLESYEDTLNNLELKRRNQQQELLAQNPDVQEDYLLNYMLDVEAKGSLLNIDAFTQPFDYQLQIATDSAGETRAQAVDLVETFNYLLGLTVHTQRQDTVQVSCEPDEHGVWQRKPMDAKARGKAQAGEPDCYTFMSIDGTLPDGKTALVVWRILNEFDEAISKTCHNIALDYYLMERKRINPREGELDVIYVNGDNTLPNIRTEEEYWKVRLVEEEFQRLMFAGDL